VIAGLSFQNFLNIADEKGITTCVCVGGAGQNCTQTVANSVQVQIERKNVMLVNLVSRGTWIVRHE
jgi:hypothetical protein